MKLQNAKCVLPIPPFQLNEGIKGKFQCHVKFVAQILVTKFCTEVEPSEYVNQHDLYA